MVSLVFPLAVSGAGASVHPALGKSFFLVAGAPIGGAEALGRVSKAHPEKVVFVLNKADKSPFFEDEYKSAWVEAQAESKSKAEVEQGIASTLDFDVSPVWIKSISTTEGGANAVMDALFNFAEDGEALFDDDIVTDYPRKLTIADVVREKYIGKLFQELPHELGILVKRIEEKTDKWVVQVDALVNREAQKPMASGRGASTVKGVRKAG